MEYSKGSEVSKRQKMVPSSREKSSAWTWALILVACYVKKNKKPMKFILKLILI